MNFFGYRWVMNLFSLKHFRSCNASLWARNEEIYEERGSKSRHDKEMSFDKNEFIQHFYCDRCFFGTDSFDTINVHFLEAHSCQVEHMCRTCSLCFVGFTDYRIHKETHCFFKEETKNLVFTSTIVNKDYNRIRDLIGPNGYVIKRLFRKGRIRLFFGGRTIKEIKRLERKNYFPCPHCEKLFRSLFKVTSHINEIHQ